jgi:tRNA(Ile)-lysidine synthase
MTSASDPIRLEELDGLFAPFFAPRGAVQAALAVSGGSDSTALMVLFADWLAQAGRPAEACAVLTVDHRLRPESAGEAQAAARQAATLGFGHATLVWEGHKPATGIQAAAREARYRLMGAWMREHGLSTLLTAHTLDDQAETLLMRLARGSGLDGLSGMAPRSTLDAAGEPIAIARPLLATPKARLRATLAERRIAWIEDPSNASLAFERARLRAARAELEALGLTGEMLALSAKRLQRARAAVEHAVEAFCAAPAGVVQCDPCGVLTIDRAALCRAPSEVAVRVLRRAIGAAGGLDDPVPLANVEAIAEAACRDETQSVWTLARAMVTAARDGIVIEREPGRAALPCLALTPAGMALWDGRFRVSAGSGLRGAVEVRALAAEELRELRRTRPDIADCRALLHVPSFWQADRLLAVPSIGYFAAADMEAMLGAQFARWSCNLSPRASEPPKS